MERLDTPAQLQKELGTLTAPHALLLSYALRRAMDLACLGDTWPPAHAHAHEQARKAYTEAMMQAPVDAIDGRGA
jgi:hypothetical protein